MKRLIHLISLVVPLAAALTVAPESSSAATAPPYCGITWGSGAKSGGALRTPSLVSVSTARAGCWDRVTFEFAGPVTGFQVRYGAPSTEGAGLALGPYTAGGALLSVSLRAPAGAYRQVAGSHAVNVLRYPTLRDVVYGGSFEGYTTFAVGAREKLPFRVFTAAGPGTHGRVILDIAHRWTA